jgi:alkylated DNA repair dioxygenase AlkB
MDWDYYPGLCASVKYQDLLNEISPHLLAASDIGKAGSAGGRYSFVAIHQTPKYDHLSSVNFQQVPIISQIRQYILNTFGIFTEYCLVHLYMDGDAGIAWHNDKEALATPVVSVSFGATREFRLRQIGQTTGYAQSFQLGSGDLLIMKSGCQQRYEHSIIKSKKVTAARINLTFRQ